MLFAAKTEGLVVIGRCYAVIIHCTYNTVNFPYNTVTFPYKMLCEKPPGTISCALRINVQFLLFLLLVRKYLAIYMHLLLC